MVVVLLDVVVAVVFAVVKPTWLYLTLFFFQVKELGESYDYLIKENLKGKLSFSDEDK